ncbi:transposase [Zhongshania sp.]|uniref:transposase n=1 Tax=Zhongshania sp. TaxID=1971902 RepID=UPI00356AC9F6
MKGKESIKVDRDDDGKITISSENTDIEYTIESLDIDPKDLVYGRGTDKYTPEQKIQAVMYYLALGGNAKKVERKTGLKASTIRKWKASAPWWDMVMAKARAIKQDELDAQFTTIIHDVVDEIRDRVEKGDYKMDNKGNLHRVPMSGKELVVAASMLFDKRSLLRGDPTSIKKQASPEDNLKNVEKRLLETINKAKEQNVVSTQKPEFEDADGS